MTEEQFRRREELDDLFVKITGEAVLLEKQDSPFNRVITSDEESDTTDLSTYVVERVRADGLKDAIGIPDENDWR